MRGNTSNMLPGVAQVDVKMVTFKKWCQQNPIGHLKSFLTGLTWPKVFVS